MAAIGLVASVVVNSGPYQPAVVLDVLQAPGHREVDARESGGGTELAAEDFARLDPRGVGQGVGRRQIEYQLGVVDQFGVRGTDYYRAPRCGEGGGDRGGRLDRAGAAGGVLHQEGGQGTGLSVDRTEHQTREVEPGRLADAGDEPVRQGGGEGQVGQGAVVRAGGAGDRDGAGRHREVGVLVTGAVDGGAVREGERGQLVGDGGRALVEQEVAQGDSGPVGADLYAEADSRDTVPQLPALFLVVVGDGGVAAVHRVPGGADGPVLVPGHRHIAAEDGPVAQREPQDGGVDDGPALVPDGPPERSVHHRHRDGVGAHARGRAERRPRPGRCVGGVGRLHQGSRRGQTGGDGRALEHPSTRRRPRGDGCVPRGLFPVLCGSHGGRGLSVDVE